MQQRTNFDSVQRIVLRGGRWTHAQHLLVRFGPVGPLWSLTQLLKLGVASAGACDAPDVQLSLGLTRRGLERANVPRNILARLALKAPAFWAGAPLRAAHPLGQSGANAVERWDAAFQLDQLDAVISLHANLPTRLEQSVQAVMQVLRKGEVACVPLPPAAALPAPPGLPAVDDAQWVHFGYRDGLSRVGIEGVTHNIERCLPTSRHQPGEFVLGHRNNAGATAWIAGPGLTTWSRDERAFFRNGSFGVLHQLQQDVAAFEGFIATSAARTGLKPDDLKGKLCGRAPDGRPLAVPAGTPPEKDFDYRGDPEGRGCPFGSHVRRMNPRVPLAPDHGASAPLDDDLRLAHFSRARPLLRRGMPYGPPWDGQADHKERGLIGHFFCASIEDQFEHLIAEWAERVPLGSPDRGGARDPLIGSHDGRDGPFEMPGAQGKPPRRLDGLSPFVRTRGLAYLFYPSLVTLGRIARSDLFGTFDPDEGT